jgi:hypothetical protein
VKSGLAQVKLTSFSEASATLARMIFNSARAERPAFRRSSSDPNFHELPNAAAPAPGRFAFAV